MWTEQKKCVKHIKNIVEMEQRMEVNNVMIELIMEEMDQHVRKIVNE